MATAGVRVSGVPEVVAALQAIGFEVEDLDDAMTDVAARGAQTASGLAPRRLGTLAGSVGGSTSKGRAVVAATVPYAGVVNYGWAARGIQGSGFMQRADTAITPYALDRLEQNVNEVIRERGLA